MTKIHLQDCLEFMRSTNSRFDMVMTSPPYNTARKTKTDAALQHLDNRYISFEDQKTDAEYRSWTLKLFDGFDRVVKPNGSVAYNISYSSENTELMWLTIADILTNTCWTVSDCITWKKKSALPNNVTPNKLTRITEYIFIFCRRSESKTFHGNKKYTKSSASGQLFYENAFNYIEAKNNDGPVKNHKATYSKDLCLRVFDLFGRKGGSVYDPFMGTGTTGLAALEWGMDYEGTEIVPEYKELADKRIGEAIREQFQDIL